MYSETDHAEFSSAKPGDVVALAFYITMLIILSIFCVGGAVIKIKERRAHREMDLHSESGMVSKSVLSRFPTRLYELQSVDSVETSVDNSSSDHNFQDQNSDNCVICYQEYIVDETIRELPCHHYFHKNVSFINKIKVH